MSALTPPDDLPQPKWSLGSLSRRRPCAPVANAPVCGFDNVRLSVSASDDSLVAIADHLSLPVARRGKPYEILAISGGAAGGAFGAGALTGWTRTGQRPDFSLVTGVSTGALIAPLAFLGAAWDEKLKDAYTGGHASQLLNPRRVAPMFSGGLLKSEALETLIAPFVDQTLITAVAAEHQKGRRLLVATTDLDHQSASVWDMGAIACHGGDKALNLFRDVLVASASLPGLFSPRRISTQLGGTVYEEMHVDGGVAAPLFILPDSLLQWDRLGHRLKDGRVHVIVNTMLEAEPKPTQPTLPAVMSRSFETMLRFSYRQSLMTAATLCAAQGIPLQTADIPYAGNQANLLNFDQPSMEALYQMGHQRALSGQLWTTAVPERKRARWSLFGR